MIVLVPVLKPGDPLVGLGRVDGAGQHLDLRAPGVFGGQPYHLQALLVVGHHHLQVHHVGVVVLRLGVHLGHGGHRHRRRCLRGRAARAEGGGRGEQHGRVRQPSHSGSQRASVNTDGSQLRIDECAWRHLNFLPSYVTSSPAL